MFGQKIRFHLLVFCGFSSKNAVSGKMPLQVRVTYFQSLCITIQIAYVGGTGKVFSIECLASCHISDSR